jgi:hypothetical protein
MGIKMVDFSKLTIAPNIRPEIAALVKRGNVTLAEHNELRCNSWEGEALVPVLTIEALINTTEYAIRNCSCASSPALTYDEAVHSVYTPELIKRLRMLKPLTVEQCLDRLREDCADKLRRGEITDDTLRSIAEMQVKNQAKAAVLFWTGEACGLSEEQTEVYTHETSATPLRQH